jgi:tetratricopeptide (TPR) repeat protein
MEVSTETIERLVRSRKSVLAHQTILAWLAANRSIEAKIQACEWYRRLGDLPLAYQTIAPEDYKINREKLSTLEKRQYLWAAQLMNLLGATSYAFQIVKRVSDLRIADEIRILANLHFSNFSPAEALPLFIQADEVDSKSSSYPSRVARIGSCDALSDLGKISQAITRLKKIPVFEEESLLKGICLQVEGSYLVKKGEYAQALKVLEEAIHFFPEEDQSFDHALLLKWLALANFALDRPTPGNRWMARAIALLDQPRKKPEGWLDCLYWKMKFGYATEAEIKMLYSYPGLPDGFTKRYKRPLTYTTHANKKEKIWISLARKECAINGANRHDLPKEIELLGLVRMTEGKGLPVYRAFTLLWPEEISNFLFLDNRLTQLLNRLRKEHQQNIFVKDRTLYLLKKNESHISVEVMSEKKSPRIFDDRDTVALSDVREYYGLKKTQSFEVQKLWLSEKRVTQSKIAGQTLLMPTKDQLE